jgi:nucleotide-binding universal stress UspA family protein
MGELISVNVKSCRLPESCPVRGRYAGAAVTLGQLSQDAMESNMSLAAIMVHVDFDEQAQERIGVAAGLAGRFSALLIGIAGWPLRKSDGVEHSGVEFPPVEELRQKKILEQLARLGENFRHFAGTGTAGLEWRSSPHFPNEVIAAHARAADLIVIGREPLPGDVYHTFDPGTVILAAGRPVLVVPGGIRRLEASRVLIAWKNTREARRAVRDALPFLAGAQSVIIAEVCQQGLEQPVREQIADVVAYLARHRVPIAEQLAIAATGAESHALLGLAREQDADLIVAGAYGRSRLREWIFGGMTRDLLRTSKIPVLFSN